MARDIAWDRALGAAIKRRRERPTDGGPRLTQSELGEAIGLTSGGKSAAVTLSRIETGTVGVSEARLRAIAEALRTTPGALREEAQASLLAEARERAVESSEVTAGFAKVVRRTLGGAQAQENFRRRVAIEAEVAERQRHTTVRLERLAQVQQELIDEVLSPFIEQASRIKRNAPPRPAVPENTAALGLPERLQAHNETLGWEIANTLVMTAAGAGAGVAVGRAASSAIVTWVAASATASTGAAIGSLTGAAATSATLAWLGGGSLAAGGLGVAGGTLVLASIATLPALIAAGGVFAYQSRRMRREAATEVDRLNDAENELADALPVLRQVWNWAIREQNVLEDLTTIGRREVRALARELDEHEAPCEWDHTGERFQERYAGLTDIVVRATAVLGLPILRNLDPEAADDEDRDERAEWIDLVLKDAEGLVERLQATDVPGLAGDTPTT